MRLMFFGFSNQPGGCLLAVPVPVIVIVSAHDFNVLIVEEVVEPLSVKEHGDGLQPPTEGHYAEQWRLADIGPEAFAGGGRGMVAVAVVIVAVVVVTVIVVTVVVVSVAMVMVVGGGFVKERFDHDGHQIADAQERADHEHDDEDVLVGVDRAHRYHLLHEPPMGGRPMTHTEPRKKALMVNGIFRPMPCISLMFFLWWATYMAPAQKNR